MCFNSWLTKFQKIPQSALSSQYIVDVAPARHELAFLLDLGPQKSLRGKRLILEISRSYVAGLEKERGRTSPCAESPRVTLLPLTPRPGRVPPSPGWPSNRCRESTTGRLLTRPALVFPEGHGVCSGEKHFHISSVYLFSI